MRKKMMIVGLFLGVSLMFGSFVNVHLAHSNKLFVVRGQDNNLWTRQCVGGLCGGWQQITGQFTQQPTLVWDEDVRLYYLYGVGGDGQIWASTFNEDGSFNDNWWVFGGSTPSPVAAVQGPALRHIVINSNEFVPYQDGYTWIRYYEGGALKPEDNASSGWDAPVILPVGAKIISIYLFYYNDIAVTVPTKGWLCRSKYDSVSREEMATVTAGLSSGYGSADTSTIAGNEINSDYSYFLRVNLPSIDNWLVHVKINYIY